MHVLLVEDNESLARGLEYALKAEGYDVLHASNVREAQEAVADRLPGLVILDVALPDGNGFFFYQKALKEKGIPTVFLTARDEEDDIVKGLELGAEDYVTKPFSTKELLVRIRKILLRQKKNTVIQVQDIRFDIDKMLVYRGEEEIPLTRLELKILELLFLNLNKVVTRNTIIDKIWEWTGNDINDNTVTVYLKRIREKIKSDIIVTIKGIGYRIDDEK